MVQPTTSEPARVEKLSSADVLFSDLQHALQARYDIAQPYRVEQFVSHDAENLQALTGVAPNAPEMLLVHEGDESLDITLFLDSALIDKINPESWDKHWNGENFDHYCVVLEGVSHFVYLSWSAHYHRSVKYLELELQAEVDKFVFAALDAKEQDTQYLISRLFDDVSYHSTLSTELRTRYEKANSLAQYYCQWLIDNFELTNHNRRLAAELARFYRINGSAKFRHIVERLH